MNDELEESRQRMEASQVAVAVRDDGSARIIPCTILSQPAAKQDGWTVYLPQDMLRYLSLTPHERMQFHAFKRTYGGSVEWKAITTAEQPSLYSPSSESDSTSLDS